MRYTRGCGWIKFAARHAIQVQHAVHLPGQQLGKPACCMRACSQVNVTCPEENIQALVHSHKSVPSLSTHTHTWTILDRGSGNNGASCCSIVCRYTAMSSSAECTVMTAACLSVRILAKLGIMGVLRCCTSLALQRLLLQTGFSLKKEALMSQGITVHDTCVAKLCQTQRSKLASAS